MESSTLLTNSHKIKYSGTFNPPASPHFGEAWERLVQSSKWAHEVIVKEQCVNDGTLFTLVAEAESMLNSRPLTPVSSDC